MSTGRGESKSDPLFFKEISKIEFKSHRLMKSLANHAFRWCNRHTLLKLHRNDPMETCSSYKQFPTRDWNSPYSGDVIRYIEALATSPHKNRHIWSFWTVSKRPARISPPLVALNDSCLCTHSTMSNDSTHTNGGRARSVRETQTQNGDKNGERVTHITASHLFWVVWVSRLQHHRAVS